VSRTPSLAKTDVTPEDAKTTDPRQVSAAPTETLSFSLRLDATDQLAARNPIAIANGILPKTLPFARREAVAALKDEYVSGEEAQRGIDTRMRKAFASHASDPALARTVTAVQDIYARNVFPAMKVKWATYPNNIGHTFFNGCFRCHDDNHKATDGSVIKQDCETCHAMP